MSVPSQLSYSNTRSTTVVKKYFSKLTMLVVAVLSIAEVVLQFLNTGTSNTSNIDTSNTSSIGIGLIISAAVAVLLLFVFLTSKKGGGNPKIFFGILHVLSLLQFIGFILVSLFITVVSFVLIVSTNTIVSYMYNNKEQFEQYNVDFSKSQEEVEKAFSDARIFLLICLLFVVAGLVVVAIYINSQTTFLRSCKNSCKGNALYYDGASSYGTLSIVVAFIYLILLVLAFLIKSSGDGSLEEMGYSYKDLPAVSSWTTVYFAYNLVAAISLFVRGSFAKGWINVAKENQAYVEQGNISMVTRGASDTNPIATFKSTQRRSNDAIHQSQAYTYGDPQAKDPNKKSEYIPEELQNDYPPQYDQNMGGIVGDPFMGDPFAQPAPQNPYDQDPFAADPFAADPFAQPPMGGNPYGGAPNPNDQGYNNGMM